MKKFLAVLAVMMIMASGAWAATANSNVITLNVNDLPIATINTVAADEAYVGDLVTPFQLLVTAPGTSTGPNPTFAWTVPPGIALSSTIVNNPTIDITGSLAGVYILSCAVTNDAGVMTSNTVTLTLYDVPTVAIVVSVDLGPPLSGIVESNTGSAADFTATPAGGWGVAPAWTYQWQKFNIVSGVFEDIVGETANTYAIVAVTSVNSGDYRCVVDDGSGVPAP